MLGMYFQLEEGTDVDRQRHKNLTEQGMSRKQEELHQVHKSSEDLAKTGYKKNHYSELKLQT